MKLIRVELTITGKKQSKTQEVKEIKPRLHKAGYLQKLISPSMFSSISFFKQDPFTQIHITVRAAMSLQNL